MCVKVAPLGGRNRLEPRAGQASALTWLGTGVGKTAQRRSIPGSGELQAPHSSCSEASSALIFLILWGGVGAGSPLVGSQGFGERGQGWPSQIKPPDERLRLL